MKYKAVNIPSDPELTPDNEVTFYVDHRVRRSMDLEDQPKGIIHLFTVNK
jgi:hypothetical protein